MKKMQIDNPLSIEKGDGNSMLELGSIYLRDNDLKQAKYWFDKAKYIPEIEHIAIPRLNLIDGL